jgi:hypothetical protein
MKKYYEDVPKLFLFNNSEVAFPFVITIINYNLLMTPIISGHLRGDFS